MYWTPLVIALYTKTWQAYIINYDALFGNLRPMIVAALFTILATRVVSGTQTMTLFFGRIWPVNDFSKTEKLP